jgi:hypothetical protein
MLELHLPLPIHLTLWENSLKQDLASLLKWTLINCLSEDKKKYLNFKKIST